MLAHTLEISWKEPLKKDYKIKLPFRQHKSFHWDTETSNENEHCIKSFVCTAAKEVLCTILLNNFGL